MFILFWLLFSVIVGIVAAKRGRSGVGWALLAVLLTPLLMCILVLALPKQGIALAARDDAGQLITSATHVRCPDCRELVRADARKCKHCGSVLEPKVLQDSLSYEEQDRRDGFTAIKIIITFVMLIVAVFATLIMANSR